MEKYAFLTSDGMNNSKTFIFRFWSVCGLAKQTQRILHFIV